MVCGDAVFAGVEIGVVFAGVLLVIGLAIRGFWREDKRAARAWRRRVGADAALYIRAGMTPSDARTLAINEAQRAACEACELPQQAPSTRIDYPF